jgi:hypothetical protein
MQLDSLANAMLAGSLAAARHPPSSRSASANPPPVPASRRTPHKHIPFHPSGGGGKSVSQKHGNNASGASSPGKTTLLTTLRQPHSKSDDEDARRHYHRHHKKTPLIGSSKKHSHHEGSRKRWRDQITAREKRRYEAVWASNRGLFVGPGTYLPGTTTADDEARRNARDEEAELVVNLVVRDIWSRSRLPPDELAEVWDLVDHSGQGTLNRFEFVVGMWLIDQRLRGRKIPARVSDSVWDSARGGIKIHRPKA